MSGDHIPRWQDEYERFDEQFSAMRCAQDEIDALRAALVAQQIDIGLRDLAIEQLKARLKVADEFFAAQQVSAPSEHVAYAEDGILYWMTGRKFDSCELYTKPATHPAPVATLSDEQIEAIYEQICANKLPDDDYQSVMAFARAVSAAAPQHTAGMPAAGEHEATAEELAIRVDVHDAALEMAAEIADGWDTGAPDGAQIADQIRARKSTPITAPAPQQAEVPHWYDSPQAALGGKTAREGYAANPAYGNLIPSQPDAAEVPQAWRDAIQEFVDRVERGEIRSKRTYAKFKALLADP